MMTKRESRIINAFINCVKRNEYTFEYACILIEDTSKYGFLTEEAKEQFYAEFEVEQLEETEEIKEENVENIEEGE